MGVEGFGEEAAAAVKKVRSINVRLTDSVLRIVAFALTAAAAIVVGLDVQTTAVSVEIVPTLPPVNIPLTARWQHLSASVYFVVVNAIACAYAVVSLVLTLGNRKKNNGAAATSLMIIVLDVAMVALLFSSCGAAGAMGLMSYYGNAHVGWKKVCNVFGRFCIQAAAAFAISLAASILFLFLVFFAALSLHKRVPR
ncbi:unnamed protein product [Cuscuta europaea]|uniref:CASP-like protein n=1 Tax=Cuscuta europaea TaxID=41803 RepID=A0A9P0ZRT1_CUSEU|nr:unnamed protein product [Cuscuta europaea]